jgi:phosphoketolase
VLDGFIRHVTAASPETFRVFGSTGGRPEGHLPTGRHGVVSCCEAFIHMAFRVRAAPAC